MREKQPILIQGGMGVGVSDWKLARAVAIAGERLDKPVLGVVSGTGAEILLARRLQDGDQDAVKAVESFPVPRMGEQILREYGKDAKKPATSRYRLTPKPTDVFSADPEKRARAINLTVVANYAEVWLARQGHSGPIGINHLEKIQFLHGPRLYGAMLAGVNYLLEGAGIPTQVPGVLDQLSQNKATSYKVEVSGSKEKLEANFDPGEIIPEITGELKRPKFLAIIASNLLATVLTSRRASGYVDGFVIEGPTAGGHNAPPRRKGEFNSRGEPVYGEDDVVDLDKIAALGRPYWLAGSYADPASVREALGLGAAGVQAGTIFALSNESGIIDKYKVDMRRRAFNGQLDVVTSAYTSPTGFPFKVAQLEGTLSEQSVYDSRPRSCDVGHLLEAYQASSGRVGFKCAAEPIAAYLQKVGKQLEDLGVEERARVEKSACLCNALVVTAGYGQKDRHGEEQGIVTLGDRTDFVRSLMADENSGYSAYEAVRYLMAQI